MIMKFLCSTKMIINYSDLLMRLMEEIIRIFIPIKENDGR